MEQFDSLMAPGEDLPFSATVNEQLVYNALQELSANDQITRQVCDKVRQWIRFNRSLNMYEESEYQLWVRQIYSKIEILLRSEPSDDFHDSSSSNVAQAQWHTEESTGDTRRE
jgi:hypothetical protein